MIRRACHMLALLGALSAGCGGASDTDAVRATIIGYLDALASGDGGRACDQLTGEQVRAVVSIAIEQVPELGALTCAEAVASLAEQLGADEKATLRDAEVFDVTIDGETATASIGTGVPIALRRADGRWLISSGIGSP